jgi:CheY-like chemotaxis protein
VSLRPRLLCIDDDALGLQVRKAVLERAGYEVSTALDAATGLQLFAADDFDGVLLDYLMPHTNGGQLAAALRTIRPDVPILLLSAYLTLPEEVLRAVDLNLLKGEGPEELLGKVALLITLRAPRPHDRESA